MSKLTQMSLLKILPTVIKDEQFAQSLTDRISKIFDIIPSNPGIRNSFEIIIDRIMEHYVEEKNMEIPGLRSTLIAMFNEKQFYAFARVLKMLQDFCGYPRTRINNYVKLLKFQTTFSENSIFPWINIRQTADAIMNELNPTKLTLLAQMSLEEKSLVQVLNSEQLHVISEFRPEAILVYSKIGRLPPSHRIMILGLNRDEILLFKNVGFEKIRSLSKLDVDERNKLLKSQPTLKELITREQKTLISLTETIGNLVGSISELTPEEWNKYLSSSSRQINVLNNLNEYQTNVISKFTKFNQVLNVLNNLSFAQRDYALSLCGGEVEALIKNGPGINFKQIRKLVRHGQGVIYKFIKFDNKEADAILALNQNQRSVLAKVYVLGHNGLAMMRHLGRELTSEIFQGNEDLNVVQFALKKKLSDVNFDSLDETELSSLFEIIEDETQEVILNLGCKGIELLGKMDDLNESMIEIVGRLSDNGMEVLIENKSLRAEGILLLGGLNEIEGKTIMNLNFDQRQFLSTQHDFLDLPSALFDKNVRVILGTLSLKGEAALRRIIPLTSYENNLFVALGKLNTDVLTITNQIELNLFATSTVNEIDMISTFMVWHLEEDLVFRLWQFGLESSDEKVEKMKKILGIIVENAPNQDQRKYFPLISGAVEVLRLDGTITDDYVRIVPSLIEQQTQRVVHSLIFRVYSLEFSIRDGSELSAAIKGTNRDVMAMCEIHLIRTMEDLIFVRWILSGLSTLRETALAPLVFRNFMDISYHFSTFYKLEIILSESTSVLDRIDHGKIIQGFRGILKDHQYLLTSFFFVAFEGISHPIKKILTNILDANECYKFFNTPAHEAFLERSRNDRYPNIQSDDRFPTPNNLEVFLYYNRGDILALLEKLEENQIWNLFNRRPLPMLQIMLRYLKTNLIELYGRVNQIREFVKTSRVEILENLTQDVLIMTPEEYGAMGRRIKNFAYWDSFIGNDIYLSKVSEYIVNIQERVSRDYLRILLDDFISEDVNRQELMKILENRLDGGLYSFLKDESHMRCAAPRRKRNVKMICMDSKNTEEMPFEENQRIIRNTLDETQSNLYDELLKYSKNKFKNKPVDPKVKQNLISRIKNIPPESLDPRIKDIIETLEDPKQFDTVLKQSGVLRRIEKVASTTGLISTAFFVGKHLAHGDMENLEYDAMSLFIMPKIGEQITNLLKSYHPISAPILGATVSNFAAFLGLAQGIIARKNAGDEVDEDIADLNIITNSVIIALHVPTVANHILMRFPMESAVLGELGGPIGPALTVPVIIGSYFIDVHLEVKKFSQHIQLSFREKLSLYWRFFWDLGPIEKLQLDVLAKNMYSKYISDHLRHLQERYDQVALSLPSFLIADKSTNYTMDFSKKARAKYPFSKTRTNSRIIAETLEGYQFVCGPSTEDAMETILQTGLKKLFIPPNPNDDCVELVSFRKLGSSKSSSRMFFSVVSDAWIELSNANPLDIVFHGEDLVIIGPEHTDRLENKFFFQKQLKNCCIHKPGYNFYYVEGNKFECDFGNRSDIQQNTVVIRSDFSDSLGIYSIIGSEHRERIGASFAKFVDGKGGGDIIRARGSTIVKGYFNDFIMGGGTVILPLSVNEIGELLAHTHINVYNKEGRSIRVDGNTRFMTADDFLLTLIRTSNVTHQVTRANVRKTTTERINLEDELRILRNLTIPNCKLVKQMTSFSWDIVLSDLGQNIFYMNEVNHGFYWEAAELGNLYILRKTFANVTISKANGLLDFQDLKTDPVRAGFHWSTKGECEINIGGLHVKLLPGFKNVKFTFDGENYFKLDQNRTYRDWCSHRLPIVGRVFLDGTELDRYHNCFELPSTRVLFLRVKNDLLLVSGRAILTIGKYYTKLHGLMELALKLYGGRIVEPQMFEKRANHPHKLIYYNVGRNGLQIYHNQPVDERHIGYIHLKYKMKDLKVVIENRGLSILWGNSTLVRIENWANYQPARNMMFAFEDRLIPNAECILSNCDAGDIVEEFEIQKRQRGVASHASRGFSWINGFVNALVNPVRNLLDWSGPPEILNEGYFDGFCITSNVNLVCVLLQMFLDKRYPRPKPPTVTMVETLANIYNLTEGFQNSFELYSNIVELVRNERYESIGKIFNRS